jgi:hypothetical protein
MTEPTGLALTLKLLLADKTPDEVASLLFAVFPHQHRYDLLHALASLDGDQLIFFSAADLIQDLNDAEADFVGPRDELNKLVVGEDLPDMIWETLRYCREDIETAIRNRGWVKERENVESSD